jgi:hypothetical protein
MRKQQARYSATGSVGTTSVDYGVGGIWVLRRLIGALYRQM